MEDFKKMNFRFMTFKEAANPKVRPFLIILTVIAVALIFIGITLIIMGYYPGYSPYDGNPLKIAGPICLGVGILFLIGILLEICLREPMQSSDESSKKFTDLAEEPRVRTPEGFSHPGFEGDAYRQNSQAGRRQPSPPSSHEGGDGNFGYPVMNGNYPVMNGNYPVMNGNYPVVNGNYPVVNGNYPNRAYYGDNVSQDSGTEVKQAFPQHGMGNYIYPIDPNPDPVAARERQGRYRPGADPYGQQNMQDPNQLNDRSQSIDSINEHVPGQRRAGTPEIYNPNIKGSRSDMRDRALPQAPPGGGTEEMVPRNDKAGVQLSAPRNKHIPQQNVSEPSNRHIPQHSVSEPAYKSNTDRNKRPELRTDTQGRTPHSGSASNPAISGGLGPMKHTLKGSNESDSNLDDSQSAPRRFTKRSEIEIDPKVLAEVDSYKYKPPKDRKKSGRGDDRKMPRTSTKVGEGSRYDSKKRSHRDKHGSRDSSNNHSRDTSFGSSYDDRHKDYSRDRDRHRDRDRDRHRDRDDSKERDRSGRRHHDSSRDRSGRRHRDGSGDRSERRHREDSGERSGHGRSGKPHDSKRKHRNSYPNEGYDSDNPRHRHAHNDSQASPESLDTTNPHGDESGPLSTSSPSTDKKNKGGLTVTNPKNLTININAQAGSAVQISVGGKKSTTITANSSALDMVDSPSKTPRLKYKEPAGEETYA